MDLPAFMDSDLSDEMALLSNQQPAGHDELASSEDDPSSDRSFIPSNSAPILQSMTQCKAVSGSHPAPGLFDPKLSDARRRQLDAINRMHSLG